MEVIDVECNYHFKSLIMMSVSFHGIINDGKHGPSALTIFTTQLISVVSSMCFEYGKRLILGVIYVIY